ncbi:hypothetical protein [Methanosarcina horonobensis]|uniref:hypothetical protein n=1 Tax=Methanosarcina horonobensis TaxID=418008 RepID=UPI00064F8045|nr:hypothetical protein [Methanosarcina horonobensis]
MYIKTKCPYCENAVYHNVHIRNVETQDLTIKTIEVTDSITEEGMVRHVLHTIQKYLSDGMEVRELCKILTKCYGIASDYCCDLVQRIKIELDMYSPDKRHLYFVQP